ncbi:MAG: T9SS type A sorting domain-containing protein [Chlorobi bacterium]|nr:T9SS type A sorting domain-containing protein [Chlorobiota bacterium]
MSFNIYRNWTLIANIPYEGQGTEDLVFLIDNNIMPGEYIYCVTALYDLSVFGFPGEIGESQAVCDTAEVIWGYELPFSENWDQGSFDYQDWTTTSSDWVIDQNNGNPAPSAPSAAFHPAKSTLNYFSSLTSGPVNTSQLTEGNIWLDFQLKLNDISAGGTEKMTVKVYDGNDWNTVYERANEGSFDWDTLHLDITSYAMSKVFQIRFEASGENNSNINDWLIDNIVIYRTCPSFCNFAINIDTIGYDQYLLNFEFSSCDTLPAAQWIEWDNGENYTGVGFACEEKACAAARWDANSLPASLNGYKISKIKTFMYDVGYDSLQFRICTGDNGSTTIYTSDFKPAEETGWIEDIIDTALYLDVSQEYWVGYRLNIFGANVFPMGADEGPAINGYGNMIKTCGSDTWDNLLDFGLDYNWNIAFYVEDFSGREIEISQQKNRHLGNFTGINLYISINGGDFQFIEFIPYIEGEESYWIVDDPDGSMICYRLTAVYESETDYCESAPFTAKDNPDEDYVCITLVGQNENKSPEKRMVVYPNPASGKINISSPETVRQIELINYTGQTVLVKQANDKKITLNVNGLKPGIYIARVKTENDIVTRKIVLK